MTQRDFVGEVRALIDAETAGDAAYYVGSTAERIVAKLHATDPELLEGWLHAQAEAVMREAINRRNASVRNHARTWGARSVFAEDAKSGDPDKMIGWLDAPYTVGDGSKKALHAMTKEDVLFVSEGYGKRAASNKLRQEFLLAIANKMRAGTVADNFDNAALDRLWHNLNS